MTDYPLSKVQITHMEVVAALDICPGCGLRVEDFAWEGFEAANGQRGHTVCVKTVRWDVVLDREATIYTPPEDIDLRIVES